MPSWVPFASVPPPLSLPDLLPLTMDQASDGSSRGVRSGYLLEVFQNHTRMPGCDPKKCAGWSFGHASPLLPAL